MTKKIYTKDEVRALFDKLGNYLFSLENYYLVYSELGLHYNSAVNQDSAKAYLKTINSYKGFFIPTQNALRSALTVELNSYIVSNDEVSLKKAIDYLKNLENAPDLTNEYRELVKRNAQIVKHLSEFRNKYYAHKSGQDSSMFTPSSDKEFQELFEDIKALFNKASGYFGTSHWFFERDSRESVIDTHYVMNNLLRGESQRVNEIDVEYIDTIYQDGRGKWLVSDSKKEDA